MIILDIRSVSELTKKLFDEKVAFSPNSFTLSCPFLVIGSLNQYVQQGHRKQRYE